MKFLIPDFILTKGDQTFEIPSLFFAEKIKVFDKDNPNSLRAKSRIRMDSSSNQNNTIFEYEITTDAPDDVIESFFAAPIINRFPELNDSNVQIYHQLADEFEYDEFRKAIDEFNVLRPDLSKLLDSYISNSETETCNDLHEYESKIAEKFDFYLQNDECRRKIVDKVSFTPIHRILSNEKLKIEDHMKFYQFLKELIDNPREGEDEDEIGLLLQFVDFKQLKGPSIADFISMSERYQLHIPGLNSTLNEQLEEMKQEIQSLKEQNQQLHNQLVQEMNELREQMKQEIQTLKEQMQIEIESKITKKIENINQQFSNLSQEFSGFKSDLRILQRNGDDLKNLLLCHEHHSFKMNETNEGVFAYLRGKQTNEFSPLFYTSQSSSDYYEMMNWDSVHLIGSDESGSFWHEFKFEETIHFSGIKLQSRIGGFPRSFDIKINNNEVVYSTKDATQLNGEYKEMEIEFEGIKEGNIVRIEQTGESWNNSTIFVFNKIELYSTDEKYEGGVFKSLMKRYGNDPHKIHVIHSSKGFDHNSFHKIDSTTLVCTFDEDNQYFDIEFSKGRMVVNGIRFRNLRNNEYLLKGSNNKTSSNEEWETINIKERKQINSNNDLWFYEVEPSTPYKYFRIMNTQTKGVVRFNHLDFFGSYLSFKENTI